MKEVLIKEAKLIIEHHPSKDARAFARSVLRYLNNKSVEYHKKEKHEVS